MEMEEEKAVTDERIRVIDEEALVRALDSGIVAQLLGFNSYFFGSSYSLFITGEEYKLFWPDQPEFVRMAVKFGAKIVPFGSVGEDDIGETLSLQVSIQLHLILQITFVQWLLILIILMNFLPWIIKDIQILMNARDLCKYIWVLQLGIQSTSNDLTPQEAWNELVARFSILFSDEADPVLEAIRQRRLQELMARAINKIQISKKHKRMLTGKQKSGDN